MDAPHLELFAKTNDLHLENTKQKYKDCFIKKQTQSLKKFKLKKLFFELKFHEAKLIHFIFE